MYIALQVFKSWAFWIDWLFGVCSDLSSRTLILSLSWMNSQVGISVIFCFLTSILKKYIRVNLVLFFLRMWNSEILQSRLLLGFLIIHTEVCQWDFICHWCNFLQWYNLLILWLLVPCVVFSLFFWQDLRQSHTCCR